MRCKGGRELSFCAPPLCFIFRDEGVEITEIVGGDEETFEVVDSLSTCEDSLCFYYLVEEEN